MKDSSHKLLGAREVSAPPARPTRKEARERTREELIRAAGRVFAEQGFHAATLEHVAGEAGTTTGAIYSNFAGKEDLFLALIEAKLANQIRAVHEYLADEPTVADKMDRIAVRWMDVVRRRPQGFMLFVELWAYSVRRPRLMRRFAQRLHAYRQTTVDLIEGSSEELTIPSERFAIIVNALSNGMAMEKLADPDGVPDDLFGEALRTLLAGAVKH